jgi:hypothetical protein
MSVSGQKRSLTKQRRSLARVKQQVSVRYAYLDLCAWVDAHQLVYQFFQDLIWVSVIIDEVFCPLPGSEFSAHILVGISLQLLTEPYGENFLLPDNGATCAICARPFGSCPVLTPSLHDAAFAECDVLCDSVLSNVDVCCQSAHSHHLAVA